MEIEKKILLINFVGGNFTFIETTIAAAQEAMHEWKKYLLYYGKPEYERDETEKPFSIYHFLDDSKCPIMTFIFSYVISMQLANKKVE